MSEDRMTEIARAMPRPTAQVSAYVEVLGPELAVQFLLAYGGPELYLASIPKGRSAYADLIGQDLAVALATHPRIPQRIRVPLAKRWLAAMLQWQGQSTAGIARQLRVSDVSVRRWLKEWAIEQHPENGFQRGLILPP